MAAYDDLNTNRIFVAGIISIVVTAVTALAVQVVYYSMLQWQHEKITASGSYGRENGILDKQTAEISQYGVDPTTGNYTIPIEKSMELMLAEDVNLIYQNQSVLELDRLVVVDIERRLKSASNQAQG